MRAEMQKMVAVFAALALSLPGAQTLPAQSSDAAQNGQADQGVYVLKANAELVLTNVVARDAKTGELVQGLKQSDFTVYENGKQQQIASFDFQSVDMATPLNEATVSGLAAGTTGSGGKAVVVAKPEDLRNHRLIVMFFDLTSMQPEDLDRCVQAAQQFLRTKLQAADLVALVSLGDTLKVDQDFTADKDALINEVGVYNGTEGQGFAGGANANTNQVEDTTGYTPDESEYNDLNTDRELYALRSISKSLEKISEKKSLLYFSGGISRDGIENEASLRSAINSAVRANLAIYSVDTRGLQAISPLGDASTGSLRGSSGAYNGAALTNNMNANFASQEVMATLELRHRRQGVLRLQRFRACICASAKGYIGVLRHRIPLYESRTRRQVSQADYQDQSPGNQARISARLLCAGGFQALRSRRPRARIAGAAGQRSARHRHGRLSRRDVLPPRRESVLCAGFA